MKILKWLDEHFEESILVFLLAMISIVMLAQIIARYIFNDSMSWPEEFSRYCYIWTVFLSVSFTLKKGNMLRVGVVMDMFPTWLQNTVKILCHLIMLYLFFLLFRQACTTVLHIKNMTKEISSAMRIPMWMMYMSVVTGFGLSILRMVQLLYQDVRYFNVKAESTIEATIKEAEAETEMAKRDDAAYREQPQQRSEA